jgi:hypothetical protein
MVSSFLPFIKSILIISHFVKQYIVPNDLKYCENTGIFTQFFSLYICYPANNVIISYIQN